MFVKDINDEVTKNLTSNDLKSFCYTNKYNQNLCQTKQFWINRFQNFNLPLTLDNINNTNTISEWISLFNKTKFIMYNYNQIINYERSYIPVKINSYDLYDLYTSNFHYGPNVIINTIYIYNNDDKFIIKSTSGYTYNDVFATTNKEFLLNFMLKLIPYLA